jgi:hypothetical protein
VGEAERDAIVGLRRNKPTWGPKKLKGWLELKRPQVAWPAGLRRFVVEELKLKNANTRSGHGTSTTA